MPDGETPAATATVRPSGGDRRGLGGRLTRRGRLAVVVIDLQAGFTDPTCGPGFDLDEVVEGTMSLVTAAKTAGVEVFYTAIAFEKSHDGLVWLEKMPVLAELASGSGWDEIDHRLGPISPDHIVMKQAASGFAGTDLGVRLAAHGIGTVILVGATTSGCVRATAVDACAANLVAYVVRECVGDRDQGPHAAALFDLDLKYADVIGIREAHELLREAAGPSNEPHQPSAEEE